MVNTVGAALRSGWGGGDAPGGPSPPLCTGGQADGDASVTVFTSVTAVQGLLLSFFFFFMGGLECHDVGPCRF